MKKNPFRKSMFGMLIVVIVLIMIYFVFSWIKPYSKYSFRSIFIDSKTHIYQSGEKFNYGSYIFLITHEYKKIQYQPTDCRAVADYWTNIFPDREGIRLYDDFEDFRGNCELENQKELTRAKKNNLLDIQIKITNNDKVVKNVSKDWFKIIASSGETVQKPDYYINGADIIPRETRGGAMNAPIQKNTENKISISLPGLATQVVLLPSK